MKKLLAIVLCISVLFCLGACGNESATTNMSNPFTEYETLDEINEITGMNLCKPTAFGTVEDKYFSVMSSDNLTFGQYVFAIDGFEYTFRASADYSQDISGIYIDGDIAFGTEFKDGIEYAGDDSVKAARWSNNIGQYTLSVNDEGKVNIADFEALCENLCETTNPALAGSELEAYYASLEGEYQDMVSQRAVMTVSANGSESLNIEISWADSAFEENIWTMTGYVYEDGLISYNDCTYTKKIYDENQKEVVSIVYENGEGFFVPNDIEKTLEWTGASDDFCQGCIFGYLE